MFGPDESSLTTGTAGRVSMPFLPTLVVVAALGIASIYCPSPQRAAPEAALAAPTPTSFAQTATATIEAQPVHLPAPLVFALQYPLVAAPAQEASARSGSRLAGRSPARLAAGRSRACPGRRCPETPHAADPMITARVETPAAEDGPVPASALPFAASVAETFAPAARVVGEAADLVRGGAATVTGSVALVAECLR